MGKCRLCLLEKELIKTSHIIPNFMYKGLLEKNKKIVETNLFNPREAKYRPTGIYEAGILCKQCDNEVLGKLESYAARVLYQNSKLEFTIEEEEHIINLFFKGVEYTKFKLFLISLLWRASISTQEIFSRISLGPKYEEQLRRMIYENNPGLSHEFATCIVGLKTTENMALRTIVAPLRMKGNGNTAYMFWINGLFYWYNVSSYNMEDIFNRVPVNENNEMTIAILKGQFGEGFFDSFIGRKIRFSRPH